MLPLYRPISLPTVIAKLFEKILLKRLTPLIEGNGLKSDYQWCMQKHSATYQVHRTTDVIQRALEEKKVCSPVFLEVSQAFNKLWKRIHKVRLYYNNYNY